MSPEPSKSAISRSIDTLEESLIALILALMTILTFSNVIARYIFNSNILWAIEVSVFLMAWLVLLGASYGVKKSMHIGVDIVLKAVSPQVRRILTLIAVTVCLAFGIILLISSWEYWYPYINKKAFLETEDVPLPQVVLEYLSQIRNDGEQYEKLPVFIPYAILPLSAALITFRYLQVAWRVIKGEQDMIIASHEAEDLMEEVEAAQKEQK